MLSHLQKTQIVSFKLFIEPTIINNKKIWANQTPSGQNKLGPSSDRAKIRSETYQGIASAMANQWG